ncbi:uncharacterized protein LOC117605735 [Osmia lignaria lignaria]|uniref:uncharacterized protein LOC117605735 n=1 Tax=Osmia lignaria lignaria TaxID=1437193 RepID=UPI00402B4BE4
MDRDKIEQQYLKVTKIFANLAGTWPYQRPLSKLIIIIISSLITIPAIYTQVLIEARILFFFKQNGNTRKTNQFFHLRFEGEDLKLLLDGMYEDWTVNKSKEEIVIMKTYAERATYFTSFYAITAIFTTVFFINMPLISRILDKLIPLNESRDPLYMYEPYYGWDEEKYFYVTVTHMSIFVILILFVFTAVDTIFIYFVQHACGLLEVSGHRFKHAIEDFSSCEKKIMDPAQELSIMEINGDTECCFHCVFLFVQLMHMFFTVLQGQFVINAIDDVYDHIYEALWYNVPPKTQALYLLALRRTLTPPEISAAGVVTFNLQSFSAIIKTSVSYFMVLKNT